MNEFRAVGANKNNGVAVTAVATVPLPVDGAAAKGWRYSTTTGEFIINSADTDNGWR